jgi:hypothetical protein
MMQHSSSCAALRGGAAEAASAACRARCADAAARTAPAARRARCAAPRCAAHTAHQPLSAAADHTQLPLGALRRRCLLASLAAAAAVAAALPAPRAVAAAEDALREATFDQLEAFAKARAFILFVVVVLHTQGLC